MKNLLLRCSAILLVVAPTAAFAIDLPVNYWVDAKVLKKEAPTGTMLTFELHTDAACTSVYHSETIDITTLSFTIEQLKLSKVKGALKAPKPARLNTTLMGVTPAAETYLQVTGTGITPVNGDCQLQIAGIVGPPGANGIDGIDGVDGAPGTDGAPGADGVDGVDGSEIVANFSCAAGQKVDGFDAAGLPLCSGPAADSIGSSEVANGSLTADDLGTGSVGASEIADGSITGAEIAAASIGTSRLSWGVPLQLPIFPNAPTTICTGSPVGGANFGSTTSTTNLYIGNTFYSESNNATGLRHNYTRARLQVSCRGAGVIELMDSCSGLAAPVASITCSSGQRPWTASSAEFALFSAASWNLRVRATSGTLEWANPMVVVY